jgi:pimeloyl-ACP methyl ester carboxylesterase
MSQTTTLIFLPGLLCDPALWAPQLGALADAADCRVADMTLDDTIAGMAARVLAAAPERFSLAEVMRQAPERVERLALLDTSAKPDTPERTEGRRELVARARESEAGFAAVVEGHLKTFVHPDRLADDALMADIRASAMNVGREAYARQQGAIIGRADQRPNLSAIQCPTLVLCGREDALTPVAEHELIAERIPGAALEIIEDCGHLTTLERPDAVNAALRAWLEG